MNRRRPGTLIQRHDPAAAGGQQPAGQLTPGGVSAHSRQSQCFGIWPSWDAIYKGRGQREIMLKTLNQQ